MKSFDTDPNGYGPDDIVDRLHRCIDSGVYGIDYTIIARPKNEDFFSKFIITEKERIAILRNLTIDNYDGWEISDNEDFPKDVIHFFHYSDSFIPRGIEDGASQTIRLYIKLTWSRQMENVLIIISFHD